MGPCCPIYHCVPKKDVCVHNNHEYQVGDTVPAKSCQTCNCSKDVDPISHLNKVECQPVKCDTFCAVGYEYHIIQDKCCGVCVQTSCVVMLPNNVTQAFKPGNIWTPAEDPCVKYECLKINNQFITVEAKTVCPAYNPKECIPGTETIGPDGCCRFCNKGQCSVTTTSTYLESDDCRTKELLNITSCTGACGTFTFYSSKSNSLHHSCSCCREISTSERRAQLSCGNGTQISYTYTHIDACGCQQTDCAVTDPSKTPATSSALKSHRRRK
ncbi:intestinal mucin-like protein [Genypterus blacodes]|uniref:intestinal mucin-like protein n=1 Tax=Genypterus blacodes TaxID=154954 RepID=UPI003F76C360